MFKLEPLPYGYDALEPYIDAETMKIHHDKHHQAYCDKFNGALKDNSELEEKSPEELLKDLDGVPENIKSAVRNNGGGFVNHNFFWQILKKDVAISGKIKEAIEAKFGSFEKFKDEFSNAAATHFGSGWAWLVLNNEELEIMSTPNQDSPLSVGKVPLLVIDVWEHGYYKKYGPDRPGYIEAFFNVINWDKVNELFEAANK
ncbi:superoxide dismutase [Candidatus Woesearchaeota archaeon]|nr:superoxide dismutase [Candidatus Woesearchaeota archaeon]|tara:strand:- start:19020 stop:19622 length:603 start_codon:yes stop_codon:yes gene_type:complete